MCHCATFHSCCRAHRPSGRTGHARLLVTNCNAPMPNLENLKKQAKQYLRWHRDGYYPVAAQIRSALPRYRDLTDRQLMASSFKLSDAQELIARKLAFESWEALVEEFNPCPARMPSNSLGPFFSPLNLSSSFLMSAPPATSIRRNLASSSHSLMAILRLTARWHAIARA